MQTPSKPSSSPSHSPSSRPQSQRLRYGRGGAGNIVTAKTPPHPPSKITTAPIRPPPVPLQSSFYTGVGGAGNVYRTSSSSSSYPFPEAAESYSSASSTVSSSSSSPLISPSPWISPSSPSSSPRLPPPVAAYCGRGGAGNIFTAEPVKTSASSVTWSWGGKK
ncbi:hypothetical protein CP532_2484 [Ophiocordyceps camponoti-leonardi (nom. inval.)]|nr:hypothetical protein CP532_2484 [Ophiocordyceps camponoti-leonardi (nom. inval.)]